LFSFLLVTDESGIRSYIDVELVICEIPSEFFEGISEFLRLGCYLLCLFDIPVHPALEKARDTADLIRLDIPAVYVKQTIVVSVVEHI
jgi:hypothetical protein